MQAQFLEWYELKRRVPFYRQYVLRMEKAGRFPRRVPIGEKKVVWLSSEIDAWIAEHTAACDRAA